MIFEDGMRMLRTLIVRKVEWVLIESVYLWRELCSYVSIVSAAIKPDWVYWDVKGIE